MFGLRTLLSRRPQTAGPDIDGTVYVIGDVHGRHDLLERLLDMIDEDADGREDVVRVLVGDYVDRGEQSAEVLRAVQALDGDLSTVVLKGNHEAMLLDFLADPDTGPGWLKVGGLQTLASFRISPADLDAARDALADRLGPLVPWLRGLETRYETGDLVVVHAAMDPALPPEMQPDEVLMWGHPAFLRSVRRDGLWVAHGHTIVDRPSVADRRIAVDTGAYTTGKLTAARIDAEGIGFLST